MWATLICIFVEQGSMVFVVHEQVANKWILGWRYWVMSARRDVCWPGVGGEQSFSIICETEVEFPDPSVVM
jgi:hypothetical protein